MFLRILSLVPPNPSKSWDYDARIAFHIGNFTIEWYGIFVAIGFTLAIILATVKLKFWYKIKSDPFYYYCLMGIPLAIFGARFWSCCIGDADWSSFFNIRDGGLAVQGGVIADILLAFWWFPFILKKPQYHVRDTLLAPEQPVVRQVSMWLYADAIMPCILIGQVIGRWGNYFNQELYGSIIVPSENNMWYLNFLSKVLPYMYIGDYPNGNYMQPLFLYEGMLNFVGLILIYVAMEFIPKSKAGSLGMLYITWYSLVRICLEGMRDNQFSFKTGTYTMCGLWLGFSILLLLLNQCNIIPKTRKYRCKFILYENTIYFWLILFTNTTLKAKLNKQNYLNQRIRTSNINVNEINQKLTKLNFKIKYLTQKRSIIQTRHEKAKIASIRTNQSCLYYLGR
ncbi:MAG: prolipoprotein diacylglyceryl transferase [Mycoplasma sp.]|nr:prolipoprotein diacylglyceryl transferase [Mycoplasma sp.]